MERSYPSIEFEAEVLPDGTIKVPVPLRKLLAGVKEVTIRLTAGIVSNKLRRRKVTEEEIERIAGLQLEQREQVIRFLESEGTLAGSKSFAKRAARLKAKKN
jgi:hypothetical protein